MDLPLNTAVASSPSKLYNCAAESSACVGRTTEVHYLQTHTAFSWRYLHCDNFLSVSYRHNSYMKEYLSFF